MYASPPFLIFFFVCERIRFVFLCMSWSIYLHLYPALSDEHIPYVSPLAHCSMNYQSCPRCGQRSSLRVSSMSLTVYESRRCTIINDIRHFGNHSATCNDIVEFLVELLQSRRTGEKQNVRWRRGRSFFTLLRVDLVWRYRRGPFLRRVDRFPPMYRWLVDEPRRNIHQHSSRESIDFTVPFESETSLQINGTSLFSWIADALNLNDRAISMRSDSLRQGEISRGFDALTCYSTDASKKFVSYLFESRMMKC